MRRRDFIAGLGAAIAMPLAARAQQGERMRRVGVMSIGSEHDQEFQARFGVFRQELERLGWNEGRNIRFDFRWPGVDAERINAAAAELVALAPDAILSGITPGVAALQRVTQSIPIVFANIADPVGSKLLPSLAKPGGNVTGFTALEYAMAGKWLELLKEIAPSVKRVTFLHNPNIVFTGNFFRSLTAAAPSFAVEVVPAEVRNSAEIGHALDALAGQVDVGFLIAPEGTMTPNRKLIIERAANHRVPAIYPFNYYARDGGLASYGPDLLDQYRGAAGYIDRILRGAKPANLPVQTPTKFDMVINLRTAKALGLTVPPTLLTRANEVIE